MVCGHGILSVRSYNVPILTKLAYSTLRGAGLSMLHQNLAKYCIPQIKTKSLDLLQVLS